MSIVVQKKARVNIPDYRVCYILDKDFNIIKEMNYICFGMLGTSILRRQFEESKGTYFRYDFISSVSNSLVRRFLKLFAEENLFRNVTVELFNEQDIQQFKPNLFNFNAFEGKKITKNITEGHTLGIKLIGDIKKVSSQEIMFVGFILRQLSNHPKVIHNFFRLLRKHPKEDKLRLFILAHRLKVPFFSSKGSFGPLPDMSKHSVLMPTFTSVNKTATVKDIQKHIDHFVKLSWYLPLEKSKTRSFEGGLDHMLATYTFIQPNVVLYSEEEFNKLMV